MTYLDRVKYEEYERDPDKYLSEAKIINFDIVYSQIPLKFYQTVKSSTLDDMLEREKPVAVSACLRSSRRDIYVDKKNII